MKILVLGNSGMLGQTVDMFLRKQGYEVFSSSRSLNKPIKSKNEIEFDATEDDISKLHIQDENFNYIINCIGVIRHQMLNNTESSIIATKVNTLFPLELIEEINGTSTKLLQIGTDCVFSGSSGSYVENSIKDPIDAYGYSKALGESHSENQMILRCSIIGREKQNHLSLMDWLLNQPLKARVQGFTNHNWNGITTLAFAKILDGVIRENQFKAGISHLLPNHQVTKFELLNLIAKVFQREDIQIEPTESRTKVDRTLATLDPFQNAQFWHHAGYGSIPTHEDMLIEYETYLVDKMNERGLL